MTIPYSDAPRASSGLGRSKASFDLYAEITHQILAMLDKGVVPWRSPILGQSGCGYPKNLVSQRPYRGANVFLLAFTAYVKGYESSYWVTFDQAKERGGNVRKGEKSSLVVFWKSHEIEDPQSGEKKNIPVLRYYRVFCLDQCEGIPVPDAPPVAATPFEPIEAAAKIVEGYKDGPVIKHGGKRACFLPLSDTIKLPRPERFESPAAYYATLNHEMAHSTGIASRLDRGLDTAPQPFGSPDYSKEELIAEMAAAFLCARARIAPAVIENQAGYLAGWLGRLRSDTKLIIQAAGAGQRAADWILGERPTANPTTPPGV